MDSAWLEPLVHALIGSLVLVALLLAHRARTAATSPLARTTNDLPPDVSPDRPGQSDHAGESGHGHV